MTVCVRDRERTCRTRTYRRPNLNIYAKNNNKISRAHRRVVVNDDALLMRAIARDYFCFSIRIYIPHHHLRIAYHLSLLSSCAFVPCVAERC